MGKSLVLMKVKLMKSSKLILRKTNYPQGAEAMLGLRPGQMHSHFKKAYKTAQGAPQDTSLLLTFHRH